MSKVLNKMNYTAQIPMYKGSIWEYDMTSAGFTMAKKSGLLHKEEIKFLENLPKQKRVVELGLMLRDDPDLLKAVEYGIRKTIKKFCISNEINESDIISIKRDAVFSTRPAPILEIDGAKLHEANKYTSFFLFNRTELYWNTEKNKASWKGLGKEVVKRDSPYFLKFLLNIIKSCEKGSARDIAYKLNNYRIQYISLKLEKECYRECNKDGMYRHLVNLYNSAILTKSFPGFENLNPIYNYQEFIIPLFSVLWKQS